MKKNVARRQKQRNGGLERIGNIMPRTLHLLEALHRQAERATFQQFTMEASHRLDRIDHAREAIHELIRGEVMS